MSRPRVLVLRAAGVNCEVETVHAWELAGARAQMLHINALREHPGQLLDYQILTIPGGFSYGDDVSAGKILANQMQVFLGDQLRAFAERDRLIIGICNGFQVLCKTSLLHGGHGGGDLPAATITANVSGKYEDRWVRLRRASENCAFLKRAAVYELPVAHGEGRVMAWSDQEMNRLAELGCVAMQYTSSNGPPVAYPDNPNGSMMDVAGLCDPSGRVFGLMPHPERFIHETQHPEWTSRDTAQADGRAIFESAVDHFH
ncbi:MAG: phosphoribosylformylglycinamidine synthase I [Planctomycetes bacterium]|nr:phosphoribosylformylglycinamidine synthase I [Planctomycetota bacterium]